MITVNELVDLRMQQHIAQEIYRQQIMQRIPDPFPQMLPLAMPHHVIMPPRITLAGVEVKLQNDDLWKQFHGIGTEMIITKSGRRMFPSMRLSVFGLDDETNYCVLLEMLPIGDCRYKFSGSQWVPAGGAEPQSPQRMYLHPDSPASGAHWKAQPILFNKVKLTNNTLDSSGHIVLASMHKYQPRIHVIRTSDLSQIPWAPQQAFVFPETQFVAVTAYQNDRITKLKIDNNPFAKGFRETGQSRCKRKMSLSPCDDDQDHQNQQLTHRDDKSPTKWTMAEANGSSICATIPQIPPPMRIRQSSASTHDLIAAESDELRIKRMISNGSSACSVTSLDDAMTTSATVTDPIATETSFYNMPDQQLPNVVEALAGAEHLPVPPSLQHTNIGDGNNVAIGATSAFMHHLQQNMQTLLRPSLVDLACISYFGVPHPIYAPSSVSTQQTTQLSPTSPTQPPLQQQTGITQTADNLYATPTNEHSGERSPLDVGEPTRSVGHKRKCFSISAILGSSN